MERSYSVLDTLKNCCWT